MKVPEADVPECARSLEQRRELSYEGVPHDHGGTRLHHQGEAEPALRLGVCGREEQPFLRAALGGGRLVEEYPLPGRDSALQRPKSSQEVELVREGGGIGHPDGNSASGARTGPSGGNAGGGGVQGGGCDRVDPPWRVGHRAGFVTALRGRALGVIDVSGRGLSDVCGEPQRFRRLSCGRIDPDPLKGGENAVEVGRHGAVGGR